jgi:hypothetical protein
MDKVEEIDAALPLAAAQKRCKVLQAGTFQLAAINIGTAALNPQIKVNKAGFNEKLSNLLQELLFVEGVVATNPFGTKMFDCTMYVEGKETKVSVFGK